MVSCDAAAVLHILLNKRANHARLACDMVQDVLQDVDISVIHWRLIPSKFCEKIEECHRTCGHTSMSSAHFLLLFG